jgi:pimeloyl-ACP methyl ester carboxylesterase
MITLYKVIARRSVWRTLLALAIPAMLAAAEKPNVEEFTILRDGVPLAVRVQSPPPERLARQPMLLVFLSADRASSMPDGRYGAPGKAFLEQGHRIVSFDLPAHGDRVDAHGSGIAGLAALVAAGEKPFDLLVADGRAVIDECLRRGLVETGRIVAAGVSRGGYSALRLAAADERIVAVAAFAPPVDWREVTEFAAQKDRPEAAALALENFAPQLAGRRIYIAVGNHDWRVGTDVCTRFVAAISREERRRGLVKSGLRYLVVDDSPGHALAAKWRAEGIQFLMNAPVGEAGQGMP